MADRLALDDAGLILGLFIGPSGAWTLYHLGLGVFTRELLQLLKIVHGSPAFPGHGT